jgi:hypothetical protein
MKEEPMQDDHDRDAWLGPMLRQAPPAAPAPCVDAETLAAWAEGTLDAAQTAAVERHAASCSRCMAQMASMARTTPPPVEAEPERPWALAPMLRWLVPLTAAATAIAIWVVVPRGPVPSAVDRPATSAVEVPLPSPVEEQPPAARQESAGTSPIEKPDADLRAGQPPPEPNRLASEAEPATQQNRELPVEKQSAPETARADAARRNEARERQALDTFAPPVETLRDRAVAPRAAAPPPAVPSAPPPSAAPVPPPAGAAPSSRAAGAVNERFTAEAVQQQMQQQLLARAVPTSESTAPADPMIQWRVMGWVAVERTIDGGKTWIKTAPPPGVVPNNPPPVRVVSVRAVDNLRAVVLTTENREFYTTNGGILWERVQENSAAPF